MLCYGQNKPQKLRKGELLFLYTALLLININLPMKFGVSTSDSVCVMLKKNINMKNNKGNNSYIM